jgi:hypothetical protein
MSFASRVFARGGTMMASGYPCSISAQVSWESCTLVQELVRLEMVPIGLAGFEGAVAVEAAALLAAVEGVV